MKGLKARLMSGAVWGLTTCIGIAMSWTQALGQSTPDRPGAFALPEPGIIGLFSAGVIGALVAKKVLGRK